MSGPASQAYIQTVGRWQTDNNQHRLVSLICEELLKIQKQNVKQLEMGKWWRQKKKREMPHKHRERCSVSLLITEKQIKTALGPSVDQEVEQPVLKHTAVGSVNWYSHVAKMWTIVY